MVFADRRKQAHANQRIATEIKEIVIGSDLLDTKQVRPGRGKVDFNGRLRRGKVSGKLWPLEIGFAVIKEMNRLGIAFDCSHSSNQTCIEGAAASNAVTSATITPRWYRGAGFES